MALTALATLAFAASASATTLYVSQRGGEDTSECGLKAGGKSTQGPCASLARAVQRSAEFAPPNTIEIGEGVYDESATVEIDSPNDNGLTIVAEEENRKINGPKGKPVIVVGAAAGTVTLSELTIETGLAGLAPIIDHGAALVLDNVNVATQEGTSPNGIEAEDGGSLTMNGGGVSMENNSGYDISAKETPVAITDAKIVNAAEGPDEAGGVSSVKSGLSITGTLISIGSGMNVNAQGIVAQQDGSVTLEGDTVQQSSSKASGVILESAPARVNGLTVEMDGSSDFSDAVLATAAHSNSTFSHLNIFGTWSGSAFVGRYGNMTVSDSHLSSPGSLALGYVGAPEGTSILVQRSVLTSGTGATRGTFFAINGNATIDSSEVLGSTGAIRMLSGEGTTKTLTVDASTVDAGAAGIANDAFGDLGVEVEANGVKPSVADVNIEGSLVLERSTAKVEAGSEATISCSYSSLPGQVQTAKGTEGSIGCAAGSAGNTEVASELPSLFSEPFTTYELSPSSAAIDSVPSSAITLPAGVTPSATDLAGDPRTVQIGTNGVCAPYQDRGALQLKGQASACTPAPVVVAKPVPALITSLALSPSAFYAAPSGATVSKRRYGSTLSWRDSQAATTTFTVISETAGRKQGHSCRKPSRRNTHAKHCTLLTALGSFTHTDTPGNNHLHFSGRLHARRLKPGTYRLQAITRNSAGSGAAVFTRFKIKR